MNKIAKYLNQHLVGNVYDGANVLEKYAVDRSALKITPKMVVVPESTNDIRRVVKFVGQLATKSIKMPITVRGAGLDKTGADLSADIVLSMEKLNAIQEIDVRSRLVRVQAGVTLGQLNSALALVGLTLPVAADPRQTIGSLIANFVTDPISGKYNGIYYYTDCLEAVTSTGDIIQTSRYSKRGLQLKKGLTSFEGAIYREVSGLIDDKFDAISDLQSDNTIDAAGYQMIAQVQGEHARSFDLMPLFFASQGTLGIITEVILRCDVLPPPKRHFVAAFASAEAAVDYAEQIKGLDPLSLDLYDARIFKAAAAAGKDPALFATKHKFILLAGFDDAPKKSQKKLKRCLKLLPEHAAAVLETEENSRNFRRVQSALSSYLNDDIAGERVPLVDDFYVPLAKLPGFLKDLATLEKSTKADLLLYGSVAANNYSIRPDVRLNSVSGRQFVLQYIKDFAELVKQHGGSITGGSPEGRTKAVVSTPDTPNSELELYRKLKKAFDPQGIFNPGVKLGVESRATVRELRATYNSGINTP